jgi:hypothetical protein
MRLNTGPDNSEVAIARLTAALPSLVAVPLPKEPPPPPVPYPKRAAHPAPTRAAVPFELKHLAATALAELVANTNEGAFKASRRRRATAGAPAAAAATTPKSAGKRPRQPTRPQKTIVGLAFEEGGVDLMALAVEWGTDLEEVAVWHYDVDMAADTGEFVHPNVIY